MTGAVHGNWPDYQWFGYIGYARTLQVDRMGLWVCKVHSRPNESNGGHGAVITKWLNFGVSGHVQFFTDDIKNLIESVLAGGDLAPLIDCVLENAPPEFAREFELLLQPSPESLSG
jgi:hypothetical protein